jgi:hypothetical protein
VPFFLEINPLPGLSPYYGIFAKQAKTGGIEPEEVIITLVNNALNRRSPSTGAEQDRSCTR